MTIKTALLLACACASAAPAADKTHWVVTWGASPAPQLPVDQMRAAKLEFDNQTLREIVHTSIGSSTVRVRLSNAYGRQEVQIGGAHIALRDKGSAIVAGAGSARPFRGGSSVSIPPNALSSAIR